MDRQRSISDYPDGIEDYHTRLPSRLHLHTTWFALFVLATLLAVAFSGALGGVKNTVTNAAGARAALSFSAPVVMRNGQFFEMRMAITAHAPIAKPVIAVPVAYWHDLTINSFHPAPAKEDSRDGLYLMEFEPMEAGERMDIKIDGQVNPSLIGSVQARIELRDDEAALASLPVHLRVLP